VIWMFVCTGNTCRSPMAAALARMRLLAAGRPDIAVFSAGLRAAEGDRATDEAVAAIATAVGADLTSHRAHNLEPGDVFAADRIYTMTRAQAETLRARYPDRAGHIAALDPDVDVFDPFGRGQEAYEEVLAQIGAALDAEIAHHIPLRIAIATDSAGAALGEALAEVLSHRRATRLVTEPGQVRHPGAFAAATAAATHIHRGQADFAVVVAHPAAGACIAANRVPGARAVWCRRVGEATATRAECDANVLCLSARGRDPESAAAIVEGFLTTRCRGAGALPWLAEVRRQDGRA
jgi:RpiB/LacA/LacB family sugar-phosphate isomerase